MARNEEMDRVYISMSAMQKYIRRNKPKEALAHARIVERFNSTMLWNRLQIIASEDIGPVNDFIMKDIILNRQNYKKAESGEECAEILQDTITTMAQGFKSWDAGSLGNIIRLQFDKEPNTLPIPKTEDVKTLAEVMSKAIQKNDAILALTAAIRIEEINPVQLWKELKSIAENCVADVNPNMATKIESLSRIYEESMNRGRYGGIFLYDAVESLAQPIRGLDNTNFKKIRFTEDELMDIPPIPDWVYDKHTLRGKMMGRGIEFFFDESIKMAEDKTTKEWIVKCREVCVKYKSLGSSGSPHTTIALNKWKCMFNQKGAQQSLTDFWSK